MSAGREVLRPYASGSATRLVIGTIAGLAAYITIIRVVMPGWLTTLRQGAMDAVSHGLSPRTLMTGDVAA